MALPEHFLQTLTAPHPKVVVDTFAAAQGERNRSVRTPATVLSWVDELSPVDLYCYLGARFGPPNGIQNLLRRDDSHNLFHWEWTLIHEGTGRRIHLLGMNFRTEVVITGDPRIELSDGLELVEQIKRDFKAHGPRMSELRRSLEHWVEFVNPYQRLHRSISKLREELTALDLRSEHPDVPSANNTSEFAARWEELGEKYSRGLGLCFGIRSMLPLMAEAYVNLLLFVLMKPEVRADERLRESTIRQPVDIRVRSLHLNCVGFAKPIDYSSQECREYHSLVNERNDLVHGNVRVEKLAFNEVYFHGRVPVFKSYRSMWERAIGVEAKSVGLHLIDAEVATVDAFISYLGSCLHPEVREQIERLSALRDLGWNNATGRIGILFPDELLDVHMVRDKDSQDQRPSEA